AWNCIEGRLEREGSFSLSIAVGVLTVAYVGLGYQFFSLVAPTRAGTVLALFLFLVWGVPAMGAPIAASARLPEPIWTFLAGFTPITGLTMCSGSQWIPSPDVARVAALIPAIGFPFLFNNMVTMYRRRIDKAAHAGVKRSKAVGNGEIVLELDDGPYEPIKLELEADLR